MLIKSREEMENKENKNNHPDIEILDFNVDN